MACDILAPFFVFFCWEALAGLGLECIFLSEMSSVCEDAELPSGAVSGGGVSGADSPSPCKEQKLPVSSFD